MSGGRAKDPPDIAAALALLAAYRRLSCARGAMLKALRAGMPVTPAHGETERRALIEVWNLEGRP